MANETFDSVWDAIADSPEEIDVFDLFKLAGALGYQVDTASS